MNLILSFEIIARLALFTTHLPFLLIVILIGFYKIHEETFAKTLLLLTFSIIINTALKAYFEHPLPPTLNKLGWAFPSGHTQSAAIFWGWIALEFNKKWLYLLSAFIITFVSLGVVHFGYHYPKDALAALIVGFVLISCYFYLLKIKPFKEKPYYIGLLLSFLGLAICLNISKSQWILHKWDALGILFGFSLAWVLLKRLITQKNNLFNTISLLIAFLIAIIGYWCLQTLSKNPSPLIHFIFYFLWTFLLAGNQLLTFWKFSTWVKFKVV